MEILRSLDSQLDKLLESGQLNNTDLITISEFLLMPINLTSSFDYYLEYLQPQNMDPRKYLKAQIKTELEQWNKTNWSLFYKRNKFKCTAVIVDFYSPNTQEISYRIRFEYKEEIDHSQWFLDPASMSSLDIFHS